MKVFLGNSPWLRPGAYGVRAGSRWPHFETDGTPYMPFPFFLAYATSLLKKHGHEARLVDGVAEGISEEAFVEKIRGFKPDVVVLEISTASLKTDRRVLSRLRSEFGRAFPIIWCGAHSWQSEEHNVLNKVDSIDFFVAGEYEFALLDLVGAIASGRGDFRDVRGLIYRGPDGKPVTNPRRDLEPDLGVFPWPERDQLPMRKYMDAAGALPVPNLQVWASRGCPFKCNFCVWPQFMYNGRSYRVRDPKDVLDEIESALSRYGLKSVYFDDDTFNIGKKRLNEIADEFKRREFKVPWGAMCRADTFDRATFENLAQSGLKFVKFGVETGVQSVADRMDKGLDLESVRGTMRVAKELGVKTHLTFSFGHIGETRETAQRTIDFALELDPDSVQFSIITPFPGTDLYRDLLAVGSLVTTDTAKYDGYTTAVVSTPELSASELEKIVCEANTRWQRHVLWRMLKRGNISPLYWAFRHPRHAVRRVRNLIG